MDLKLLENLPNFEEIKNYVETQLLAEIQRRHIYKCRKQKAKAVGLEFHIEFDEIEWPTHCPALGIELQYGNSNSNKDSSPSIDRIDNTKGYLPGNVQVLSTRANRIKSDGSLEELSGIVDYLKSLRK